MNIRTPKTSISSCNSDRPSTFDRALRRMQNFGVSSIVGALAGAIGLQVGMVGVLAIGGSLSIQQTASAQLRITNVTVTPNTATNQSFTTTTSFPCDSNVGTCDKPTRTSFGTGSSNDLNINSVTTSLGTYTFRRLSNKIVINRLNNPNVMGDRQLIYFQGDSSITKAIPPVVGDFKMFPGAVSTMETALLNQAINRGSDNIFANTFSTTSNAKNYNNVERVDYIITDGITPTTNAELDDIGFVVMDRGSNDSYKIAPILTLASGSASTFGTPVTSVISVPTTINGVSSSSFYVVTRLEAGEAVIPANLHPVDTNTQTIGGYFVSLRSLGIAINQTIYGYSLLSPSDGPSNLAQMNSTSISGYPNNTDSGGGGGFDLVAGGGIFTRNAFKYMLSGNVFNDGNGTKLKDGTGAAEDYTAADITAVLLDSTNKVITTAAIDASGNYSLANVLAGTYTVKIIKTPTTPLVIGAIIPVASDILPTNFVPTGENIGNTTPGIDAIVDRTLFVTVATTNITGINFGIEQLPTAVAVAVGTQGNPGGTSTVDIPPGSFNTSSDPDGIVTSYKIIAFPSNVTSITIDGAVYTAISQTGTTAFPAGGVIVLAANLSTIKVDPIDGAVTVGISFKAIDNAGKESGNTAIVNVPFTAAIDPPQLILLKRITKINRTTIAKASNGSTINLTTVVPQPNNPDTLRDESNDSTINSSNAATTTPWPAANYPQGSIDAGVIKTGDLIEYTIYFLSNGGKPVTNANLCDWVPTNTVFEPNSYGVGQGIQLAIGFTVNTLTNVPDGDRGVFFNPGTILPATYPSGSTSLLTCRTPAGFEGAVVVNLVKSTLSAPDNQLPNATSAGTPGNSYGFIRFVSKVK